MSRYGLPKFKFKSGFFIFYGYVLCPSLHIRQYEPAKRWLDGSLWNRSRECKALKSFLTHEQNSVSEEVVGNGHEREGRH